MASRHRSSSNKSVGKRGSRRRCGSGGRRKRTEKKLKHKWHQRGCQSQTGGGSMTGGWAWGASDVHHQTAGSGVAPSSINGNHYVLNTATVAPPQASNAIVERYNLAQQTAGRRRRHHHHRRSDRKGNASKKQSRHRILSQHGGGVMALLPELVQPPGNSILQMPGSFISALQGPATPYVSADPTTQPIGQPIVLK